MSLVIEDGSQVASANSYATVAELRGYAAERGDTVPAADAACEVLLIKAMDVLESKRFVGDKSLDRQRLQWPRRDAVVENWYLQSNEIPRQLIQAQCALAIESQTTNLLPVRPINEAGPITSKSVAGAISFTYANTGVVRRVPAVARADALLRTLLKNNGLEAVRS